MENIKDYQYNLTQLFGTHEFEQEIEKYESLLGQKFDKDLSPHYYSGNIDKAKYLSITLNPVTSDFSYTQSDMMRSLTKIELEEYCNNWFGINEGKVHTFTFTRINKMIDSIEGLNLGGKFKALNEKAAIIDLVPFFSKTTSFSNFNTQSGLGKEIWERVYNLSQKNHIEAVFMIGSIFKDLFNDIEGGVEKESTTKILTSKKNNTWQTVVLRKKGKFYHLSHACSARGMNDKIFTEFIPNNL